jgi:glycine oxidase
MQLKNNEVVIIGGGIIGATLAYWLTEKGITDLALLEANPQAADEGTASFASAGILAPPAQNNISPELFALEERGRLLYPELIAKLQEEISDPLGWRETGQLTLAANGAEVRGLQKRQRWQESLKVESRWLTTAEVAELEPLAGRNVGALYNPCAIVRPAWLTRALLKAVANKGATVEFSSQVSGLIMEDKRVKGVKLANGDTLTAGKVVLAAGSWSGVWLDQLLAEAGLPPQNFSKQIFPVRGQMLSIQPPDPQTRLNCVLWGGHGYVLPWENGTIAIGATVEPDSGFAAHNTPSGLRELGLVAHKLLPALENAPIRQIWAGLRPGSADENPIIGELPQLPGLWLAGGHFRRGVGLAPATAELLCQQLVT